MQNHLTFTAKPNEFCVTVIAWHKPGEEPITLREVYTGPEEHGSSGPFFDCRYAWQLYESGGGTYTFLLWTYKTRSGVEDNRRSRQYERLYVFRGASYGKTWECVTEAYIDGLVAES